VARSGGGGTWLRTWDPEDPRWEAEGRPLARRTLVITTASLLLAFAAWFMVSALVTQLPGIGFRLTPSQLFWLTALPGLAGGTLRIIHAFLTPIYGTRHVVAISTLLLLVPILGWAWAVQNPDTPYWVLMLLAFAAGLGGGNFSSFMPSTSLFFPKRLQGTALAIQAGVGNFGVSVVQFLTPWVIGLALFGVLAGAPQTLTGRGGGQTQVWLQNAALVYAPFVLLFAVLAWVLLRSVPVRANLREQFDIFRLKHALVMTILYVMTFGTFSGLSATFPLLIRQGYGHLPGAPDPLTYAFLGPLVGSAARIVAGPISDRWGGGRVTQISAIGMVACALAVPFFTTPQSMSEFKWFVAAMLGLFLFSGIGNASTFKQMPMIFPPRQAAGVIGWTAAIAAYGPFFCGLVFAQVYAWFGTPNAFFYWGAAYFAACGVLNWWYYARRGAEKPC